MKPQIKWSNINQSHCWSIYTVGRPLSHVNLFCFLSVGGSVHQVFFAGFFIRSLFDKNLGCFCTMWTEQHFVRGLFVSFFVISQCGKDVEENWPKNSQGQDRCQESFCHSEKSAKKCAKRLLTKKSAIKPLWTEPPTTGACQCLSQVCCPPILSSPVQPT